MKLATRFWLSGAVLPLLVMGTGLAAADHLFHVALATALDCALLAQAAIESVSLFDGPQNAPHLHMATSPLVDSVRPFAPEGVLFGPDGRLVMRYPPDSHVRRSERLLPGVPNAPPHLSTVETDGVRERQLVVTVASPHGELYALRLSAGMAQLDAASDTFHQLAGATLLVTALVLLLVQSLEARSLRRRLTELTLHAEAMRAGELEHPLAPEPVRDELAVLRDVLSHATRALKHARDTRERFVADAAHELRTPLTLMRTNLDLALRRERPREELKAALGETREEVVRLTTLAGRLLDLASVAQQRGEREPCDLVALIGLSLEGVRAQAEHAGLRVSLDAPPTLVLTLHPEAIRRAIDNLLSNALKYARTRITVNVEEGPSGVRVCVADDGPGIPESERELVFEPFHRVRGSAEGAGLGLAIVREVACAHEGRAFVRPSAEGACVVLELTRVASDASAPAAL